MSGPSEKAVQAAIRARNAKPLGESGVRAGLAAAHDPSLGLDRSVCLGDVLDAIRDRPDWEASRELARSMAYFIEREFGGGS